ncbi:MAG: glycosyltransferase family 9 protein [Phreatobacter sp.]|uniref:glycosyltransferase family 9 protein n=1 Tax=Phreatobacter sp. TaxID=1966341 RepID=UPI001A4596C4|nr:glycosyltransferase family 9 protein [Phreatobacter sp.]MBL8571881.1 glycosyltransferase family 9 protein [Phreatobacter sp.]
MRLLFVTATRIGDAVLSTGLLGHLLDRHPGARVTVACGAPARSLFTAVPGLERLIVLEKRKFAGHWFGLWASTLPTRWTVAVDLRGSLLTNFLWRARSLVDRGAHPGSHRVVELGRLAGVEPPPAPRVWLTPEHRARAAARVPADRPVLAIGPAANWPPKTWPIDRFVALMQALRRPGAALAGARVLVAAAPAERPLIAPMLAAIAPGDLIDLTGGDDLLDVAACLERAALYVGNDSGLMHLAAAAGAPTLGLFGPSPDARYAPWGSRAAVLRADQDFATLMARARAGETQPGRLMESISVAAATTAAEALLTRVVSASPARPAG